MNKWLHTLKFALRGHEESATRPDLFYHRQTADRSKWTGIWIGPRSGVDGAANREIVTAAVNETLIISLRAIKRTQTVMKTDLSTNVRCRQSHPIYFQNTGHAACDMWRENSVNKGSPLGRIKKQWRLVGDTRWFTCAACMLIFLMISKISDRKEP
jgi:hypothetical protein